MKTAIRLALVFAALILVGWPLLLGGCEDVSDLLKIEKEAKAQMDRVIGHQGRTRHEESHRKLCRDALQQVIDLANDAMHGKVSRKDVDAAVADRDRDCAGVDQMPPLTAPACPKGCPDGGHRDLKPENIPDSGVHDMTTTTRRD